MSFQAKVIYDLDNCEENHNITQVNWEGITL